MGIRPKSPGQICLIGVNIVLHSLLTILIQQHPALSVMQMRLSVGRQMNYSVSETGVQNIHAIEDYAMTNTVMEVKCSVSLLWAECRRRSGNVV